MASLSLPRVLQLKKNSLDAEREQFEKFQSLAINKAINSNETPVKEKHVRSTIIGTFQEQSAITYWMVAIRLPLQDNRIAAWKFCHVTHKLLREGHPACLDDSQRHIGMIENLGKLWVHLREGYGRLINLYTSLLVTKLKFHARNPRFPGNMQLTADELDNIAENDVNNYFQLCVELFDYMDDILNLQAAVFDSLGNARANSMTASGQCRLAALIPCAQDSSHIYDCNVRLLFRLHASLPPDTLSGHRERFRQQFKKLSSFYKHASSLQYYRNLLTLPVLPSNPPNFLLQSDFGTYVAPVVSVPEPPPDDTDAVGSLVDTSDTISQATTPDHLDGFDTRGTPSPQPDPLVERDRLIDHLQSELKRMRSEVSQLVQERNTMLGSMREHCTRLETQLQSAKVELEEERQKAEVLSIETPEIKQKLVETEEKAKVTDEKFQKLKGAYTHLREEHINLIRQKAEVDKTTASLRAAAAQHESAKAALQQQLNDRMKDVELLQQSASSSEEIEAYKSELTNLRTELEQSRQKELELETLRASMEALEIEHKTATAEQQDKLTTVTNELKEVSESLEKIKQEKEERESELSRVKVELVGLREKSGEEYKRAVEEKDAALKQVLELTQQHQQEKEEQGRQYVNLHSELDVIKLKLIDKENALEKVEKALSEYQKNISTKESELENSTEKIKELQSQINAHVVNLNENEIKIINLQESVNKLEEINKDNDHVIEQLRIERDLFEAQLQETTNEEQRQFQQKLIEKEVEINELNSKIKELQEIENKLKTEIAEIENSKIEEITKLQKNLLSITEQKDNEISVLKRELQDKIEFGDKQKSENEIHLLNVKELKDVVDVKNREIETIQSKLDESLIKLEKQITQIEELQKDNEQKVTSLENNLRTVTTCKDEMIDSLKNLISEKDEQVISLNVEVNKLNGDVSKLEDELKEALAELEITKNEILTVKEEHELIVEINEKNVLLKNEELRALHQEISKLTRENSDVASEKDKLLNQFTKEKQILETKIQEMEVSLKGKFSECETLEAEKEDILVKLNSSNDELSSNAITIADFKKNINVLRVQNEELQAERAKEKEEFVEALRKKEQDEQILEGRLQHAETSRLNAECELQDLLQHNSVLEADLAASKRQLEEVRLELEKQTSRLVQTAGDTAVQVTNDALSALDNGSAQEANRNAAQLAAAALETLAKHKQIKGNEDEIARTAVLAAHNAARLSAYVAEICDISTNLEASDKLSSQCRAMLSSTKQCLSTLRDGVVPSECGSVASLLRDVASSAVAMDGAVSPTKSVDDELADMDTAIEQAAEQIEELLKASRAGDSGVKLEVNEKILDACTTLMGAVKILVQDARKLQNELGDPNTRMKMYRRNPQWSEGLISAAKAVVFAAKLLVTSADEAVGSLGRVEGVSAAAHEVAGSTAQLVAASRARAPPASAALARLTAASRNVAAATGAVVAAVRAGSKLHHEQDALDTSALSLTATRRLEMESKVRALELETALDNERARLAALRKRHYQLAQTEENGNMTNGKQ